MIEQYEIAGPKDTYIKKGTVLCRKIVPSRLGAIFVPEEINAGAGWFVVVAIRPPEAGSDTQFWGLVEIGAILITSHYAGAPMFDLVESDKNLVGAFYFLNPEEALAVVPIGSDKHTVLLESMKIVRTVRDVK